MFRRDLLVITSSGQILIVATRDDTVNAGGGIRTHEPLRDEVSPPKHLSFASNDLAPLTMLGNPRDARCFNLLA